jgi:integrase
VAKKTNCEKNGVKYYRVYADAGRNPDGSKAYKDIYGEDKSDAEAKKQAYEDGIRVGMRKDYEKVMLGKAMHEWLFNVERHRLAHNSFDRYETTFRLYVKPTPLHGMKIQEITTTYLKRVYKDMIDEGKTPGMVFDLNKLLRKFFFYCMSEDFLKRNPCSRIELPKKEALAITVQDIDDGLPEGFDLDEDEDGNDDVDPFTDDEIEKIKKSFKGYMRTAFLFDLVTGLRRGELLGLIGAAVDVDKRIVKVRKALKRVKIFNDDETYKYEVILDDVKTKNSKRDVPLPADMKPLVKSHIRSQMALFLKHGKHYKSNNFLFTTDGAKFIDGHNFLRAWERGLKRANVRYRKFHNVRHTYATRLFEAGVDLVTVSRLMGHANIDITANTYIHVMPKQKDTAVDKISYLIN